MAHGGLPESMLGDAECWMFVGSLQLTKLRPRRFRDISSLRRLAPSVEHSSFIASESQDESVELGAR